MEPASNVGQLHVAQHSILFVPAVLAIPCNLCMMRMLLTGNPSGAPVSSPSAWLNLNVINSLLFCCLYPVRSSLVRNKRLPSPPHRHHAHQHVNTPSTHSVDVLHFLCLVHLTVCQGQKISTVVFCSLCEVVIGQLSNAVAPPPPPPATHIYTK
jgi:hypothetical protein